MYSYALEFNLEKRGDDAEEFLADAARRWPELWESLPGVTATLLLSNALALGGEFEYQWRVDITALSTLADVDAAMKGDRRWRETRAEWFRHRTAARAHLSEHVAGNENYAAEWGESKDGAVHFVHHSTATATGLSTEQLDRAGSLAGVVSVQTQRSIAGGPGGTTQTWLRLADLRALDAVTETGLDVGAGRLFGELREVDGSLFAGA